ncbi:MAG: hypothetical protein MJ219_00520 [Mycoplasmoidaceae bacterium]|nr:hypothetical protein [Mycoplasmoidaceae bacterium]
MLTYPQIELESGQKIRLRGDNSDGFNYVESSAKYSYYSFYFYITGNISGNIMSLLSPDFDDLDEIPCPGCFYRLFYNSSIINASELILPASQLEPHCYDSMFLRCNLLTHSPKELPATTLDDCCYEFMFEHCASLTTTPTLPAETLAPSCYD